jgi:Nif-specific regulatory protein
MSSYRTLFEIGKALVAETDINKLLPLALDKVIEQTKAQRGMILVYGENGGFLFETARDAGKKDIEQPESEISKTIIQSVRETGRSVVLKNALEEPMADFSKSIPRLGLLSVACAPLQVDGNIFGVIYIDNRNVEALFNKNTEKLLAEFSELISVAVNHALERRRLESEAAQKDLKLRRQTERRRQLEMRLAESEGYEEIKGLKSLAMLEVCNQIEKVAATDSAVLIIGETGTGKELVARVLHRKSARREEEFVSINCAALPENLLEAELFGHAKGAFTGADKDKMGYFETADGGTIFLDEIAKSSRPFQTKLLRVLETGEFNRLGETKTRKANVRIISAASPDLPELIKKGEFYPDLYYRLEGFVIRIPPLRERREDLLEIAEYFLKKFAEEHERGVTGFSAESREMILGYSWPGNVRELRNAVNRAVILAESEIIQAEELPIPMQASTTSSQAPEGQALNFNAAKQRAIENFEREFLCRVLGETHGNISAAARLAGMYKKNFIQKMQQYGIKREDFVRRAEGEGQRAKGRGRRAESVEQRA